MNLTATRMEFRLVTDDVRGGFSCAGEGRRVDARSPWPGAGGSLSRISPPRGRGKYLKTQPDSGSLGGLMNSMATRMEFRLVMDDVRGELSRVSVNRRSDALFPCPVVGVPFIHVVCTEALAAQLPGHVPPSVVPPLIEATEKPTNQLPGSIQKQSLSFAVSMSGTKSLDFAADDPAGLSASELEPSPDGAAAGAMRRATGNSGINRNARPSDIRKSIRVSPEVDQHMRDNSLDRTRHLTERQEERETY